MKVIVAGFSKTGTKTMSAALRELDYKVYDYMDHFWYHGGYWKKILTSGGKKEDFKIMYEDIDAVTNIPSSLFWEEISEAFPDSKIILTIRDENSWYKSWLAKDAVKRKSWTYKMLQVLSPTGWKLFRHLRRAYAMRTGVIMSNPCDITVRTEMVDRRAFRHHQTYCLQNAPKDKFLVFNVKDGWEPLCKFLGKDIPNKEFPHVNKGASLYANLMKTHPAMFQMQREMLVVLSVIVVLAVYCINKCFWFS
ncbi:unnamed protein product [Clavelina lepadiformis]|uniref:Sulfotransferase family protein n=1 Tax=Clavelina lepadiformis TaxID=159417 RepID=A0ABP0GCG0_CLALP